MDSLNGLTIMLSQTSVFHSSRCSRSINFRISLLQAEELSDIDNLLFIQKNDAVSALKPERHATPEPAYEYEVDLVPASSTIDTKAKPPPVHETFNDMLESWDDAFPITTAIKKEGAASQMSDGDMFGSEMPSLYLPPSRSGHGRDHRPKKKKEKHDRPSGSASRSKISPLKRRRDEGFR